MKQTDPQFKLRLPPGLKERLQDVASSEGKTLTALIVERLQAPDGVQQAALLDEVHLLRELYARARKVDRVTVSMLSMFLGRMYEQLPPAARAKADNKFAMQFAAAVEKGDPDTLLTMFESLVKGDAAEEADVAALREETKEAREARKRGEDLSRYAATYFESVLADLRHEPAKPKKR